MIYMPPMSGRFLPRMEDDTATRLAAAEAYIACQSEELEVARDMLIRILTDLDDRLNTVGVTDSVAIETGKEG